MLCSLGCSLASAPVPTRGVRHTPPPSTISFLTHTPSPNTTQDIYTNPDTTGSSSSSSSTTITTSNNNKRAHSQKRMGGRVSSLVFQPPSKPSHINSTKYIMLPTAKGNMIPAFYFDRSAHLTVLVSHGNAEDLGMIYDQFFDFSRQLNVNVMAYEYSGYGKATGTPSEANCYADIDAAFKYLVETKKVVPKRIVLYGRSVGSGPTCYLAERLSKEGTPVGGLILQAPMLSIYRVVLPLRFTMCGDMFPNVDRVPHIESPIFVIHGTRDEIVPFEHGQELFMATPVQFRARPFWVEGGEHNNLEALLRQEGTYFSCILEFLREWCFTDSHFISRPLY